MIERWDPWDLEIMLQHAWREQERCVISENTYITKILEAMAYPDSAGEYLHKVLGRRSEVMRPLLRTYLLDPTSAASDRRKLGFPRALTIQDRYELLRCVWLYQQGLASDLAVQKHTRLWVFLNEAENILEYPKPEQKAMAKGLNHIISGTGHFLTLWVNISEPEPETI
jgi:hypothetical protein